MSEQAVSGGGPASDDAQVCPWCSAALPTGDETRCPSCGASLKEAEAAEVPGVTRVDHEAILKARAPIQKSRGLIGWLSGEYEAEPEATPAGSIEPPDAAVRREMLRLELAALEAEVQARQVEAIIDAVDAGELDLAAALDQGTDDEAVIVDLDTAAPTVDRAAATDAVPERDAGEAAADAPNAADDEAPRPG